MKKIGFCLEWRSTFPPAVVEKINSMNVDGVDGRVREDRRHPHG